MSFVSLPLRLSLRGSLRAQARLQSTLVTKVDTLLNFHELTKSPKLSIIDFYATWCGPCKLISPVLEKFLEQYKEDTQFLKIDVDELSDIAQEYGITAMPTLLFFKNGEGLGKIIGANPNGIKKAIEELK